MKYTILLILVFYCSACSVNNKISQHSALANGQEKKFEQQNSKFGYKYFSLDFASAMSQYNKQSDSLKHAIMFTRYQSNFFLTNECENDINKQGGVKSILKKILTTNNFNQLSNLSHLDYDLIVNQNGKVISNAFEIIQLNGKILSLNNEEVENLISFGKTLLFQYDGACKKEFVFNFQYSFSIK